MIGSIYPKVSLVTRSTLYQYARANVVGASWHTTKKEGNSIVRKPLVFRSGFHSSSIQRQSIKDPYKALGLNSKASQSEIKKAYYKLAKKYHPDINKEQDAEKKFHDLQNAYEILSDETKRKQYDQFGAAAFDPNFANSQGHPGGFGGFGGGGGAAGNPFGDFGGINFEDLFGAAFSGRNGGAGNAGNPFGNAGGANRMNMFREYKGDSIHVSCKLDFKDAVFGKKNVKLTFNSFDQCHTCHGSGMKSGAAKETCQSCHGSGTKVHIRGGFQMMSTCNECQGEGSTVKAEDVCHSCHGDGVEFKHNKTINVDLPNGLQDGDAIRISSQGSYPQMAVDPEMAKNVRMTRGDIIVTIHVDKDPKFSIKNKYDIWYQMDIPITTAALGGTVEIPTVDGTKIRLKVQAGTQHDEVISIPNMGVPRPGMLGQGGRGHMKVQYRIVMKKPQSKAEKCLWEALADVTHDSMAKRTMNITLDGINGNQSNSSGSTKNNSGNAASNPDEPNALSRLEKFISGAFKKIKGDKD
ncbi:similar to Saccharomyces cerevisiae YFL016C MDJ1 Co-chaperone that stimulates the ATPase activity of the HSP70 protein Ssc1p [Maudiozyma barnettii]|uniref:DnaJ homolog 1, mitochondrial n=1 Tax=Maudiozyma barnettii TaxID=61262 RepID=A0A8H2ZG55_9SACH|nr:Mdj1p [Kazachstania barnettii]CAB4252440.1 similar to Saccharomyces cerevisiae YFL016C MDJ1 Co-chaperone that stimulates the ATPase activity of the HSP70 protein Ssc1p [Kazachstania barnettii]CAD1779175.1 similar to Saccharomyces cerevisiae YFL016C MDJ1 Co-chaperone that stimulates the ATPase activity of the HSP70 protein Ssc1p [Kazachstania barnettii]